MALIACLIECGKPLDGIPIAEDCRLVKLRLRIFPALLFVNVSVMIIIIAVSGSHNKWFIVVGMFPSTNAVCV